MRIIKKVVLRWLSNSILRSPTKVRILRFCGIEVGENTVIGLHVYIDQPTIKIGHDCIINVGTTIICGAGAANISIGNNVQIGPNSTILGVTHKIGDQNSRAGKQNYQAVKISDGSWLGGNVTVIPGVNIAKGCIIAAGAVVIKDTEPNGLYAGVPAVRKKNL